MCSALRKMCVGLESSLSMFCKAGHALRGECLPVVIDELLKACGNFPFAVAPPLGMVLLMGLRGGAALTLPPSAGS